MKPFFILMLALVAPFAIAGDEKPPYEIHGNEEYVLPAPPTAAQLEEAGKALLAGEADSWGSNLGYLKAAKSQGFYSISVYYDYKENGMLGEREARILGVYKAQAPGGEALFGVFFDARGNALKLQGLKPDADEACVPYYFYKPGHYNVRYFGAKGHNLYDVRARVIKALPELLKKQNRLSGSEYLSMGLEPNGDASESQQTLTVDGGIKFLESSIENLDGVEGAIRIEAQLERSGQLGDSAACERLK